MVEIGVSLTGDVFEGLDKLEAKVKGEILLSGVAAMARVVYDEVKIHVPVKTGTLRDAIYRAYSPENSSDAVQVYRVSWNRKKAPHGHLIEFGTSKMAARPFIRPAFDRIKDAIRAGNERMKERMEDGT